VCATTGPRETALCLFPVLHLTRVTTSNWAVTADRPSFVRRHWAAMAVAVTEVSADCTVAARDDHKFNELQQWRSSGSSSGHCSVSSRSLRQCCIRPVPTHTVERFASFVHRHPNRHANHPPVCHRRGPDYRT
jgi:hypothetical protein